MILDVAMSLTPEQLEGLASSLLQAVQSGKWDTLAASALMLAMWAVRKFGGQKWSWLATNEGLLATGAVGATIGAMLNALAGGGHINGALLLTALGVGLKALGGWKALVYLLTPVLKKLGINLDAAPTPIAGEVIKAEAAAVGAKAALDAAPASPMDLVNK